MDVHIRLLGIDIDGTLLNSQHELSQANIEALRTACARGIEIVLVTGRRFDFAMPIASQIPCPLTLVVSNGAIIKSRDGITHFRRLLPRDIAGRVLAATLPYRAGAALVFDRPRKNQVIWEVIAWDDPGRRSYFERNREFIAQMPLEEALTEDPIQVMFTGAVAPMRAVEQLLQPLASNGDFALSTTMYEARDFALVDVLHAGCSKGAALRVWAEMRGIPREQVMAIGDNYNDLEMLEFAGLPVVMANCVPELRRNGWLLTRSNDEDGVAAAIQQLILENKN